MAPKPIPHNTKSSFSFPRHMKLCLPSFGATLILFTLWIYNKEPNFSSSSLSKPSTKDPVKETLYDDPNIHFYNWDMKRGLWLKNNPNLASNNSVMVVSGSQTSPCKSPSGDHFLLRFFKNKVDYCRIHGYKIFYNNAYLEPNMRYFWAKIPVLKAAMLAHPETEWLFWVDSDAVFTDMEFTIPLERYEGHNMVVHGFPNMIYEDKSWVGLNAGVFLIRNCQWTVEFLDVWANMGPMSPDYNKWGKILSETLKDRLFLGADDQSALVYLLLKGDKKWTDKIYVENQYYLHGYWLPLVKKFDNIAKKYIEIEKRVKMLRRRHAEAEMRRHVGEGPDDWRRPFVTHFTGCQPCSGDHNPNYKGDSCWIEIERALNFADNQVLRNYGFVHPSLKNGSLVRPLPFDYPSDVLDYFT
ncbi:alpha-6-galactosyltransferase [Striga asiatica]|uniref:Alpha-6-galactosyltransferase n=1 Tax=Striga asiatica TaxID=4170 RepID=A0A5A7PE56_STRAF|nr:alpha-6-galactosyltransferase [Striga asiatica]